MPARTVTGSLVDLNADPAAGVRLSFKRSGVVAQDGDVVLPDPVETTTASGGTFSIDLLPGNYSAFARTSRGPLRFTFSLASTGSTDLAELLDEAVIVATPDAVTQTRAARDEAIAAVATVPLSQEDFSTVAALLADTTLTYTPGQPKSVTVGQIVPYGGHRGEVAPSDAEPIADDPVNGYHITTAGGVKLYVLPGADGAYNVKAFGATADGSTDDTAAIVKAIAAAEAVASVTIVAATNRRPSVHLPAGIYKVTSSIVVDFRGLCITGEGPEASVLAWYGSDAPVLDFGDFQTAPDSAAKVYSNIANSFIVRDIRIQNSVNDTVGTRTAQGIRVAGSNSGQIKNVFVRYFEYGVNLAYGTYSTIIDGLNAWNCDIGLYVGPGAQASFVDGLIAYYVDYGVVIDRATHLTLNSPRFDFPRTAAILFERTSDTGTRQCTTLTASAITENGVYVVNSPYFESSSDLDVGVPTYFMQASLHGGFNPALVGPYRNVVVTSPWVAAGATGTKQVVALMAGSFQHSAIHNPVLYGEMDYWLYDTAQNVRLINPRVVDGFAAIPYHNSNTYDIALPGVEDNRLVGVFPQSTTVYRVSDTFGVKTSVGGNGQWSLAFWSGSAWVDRFSIDVQNNRIFMGGNQSGWSVSRAAAQPSSGTYTAGSFVYNTGPVVSAGKSLLGWHRLTTGSGHVDGTDWTPCYVTNT